MPPPMPRRPEPLEDWYDLPLYYDIVFDTETQREADFLEGVAGLYGSPGRRRVLEPACGSGRLVLEMARRGWQVAGFDRNPAALRYCRERLDAAGLRAGLFRGTLEDFQLEGGFDLAHCLVTTFKYVLTEAGARRHLEAVARALRPGGLYVLGFHLSEYDSPRRARERWVAERDGIRVTSNLQIWPPDRRRRRERARIRLKVERDGTTRVYESHWWFRTYDAGQVRRLLRAAPAFDHLATYDFAYELDRDIPLDGRQLDVVLVLRRRG